jgi:hypothetical protein
VGVRLPPFWAERPAVCFDQAEAQFFLAGISSEKTKFCHVVSQTDHRYAAELENIITSLPERNSYTTLRTELMRRLSPSREQCIRQLLKLEMGDRRPSQFLRHFRSLAPDVSDDFLHTIWSSRLPPNIQVILVGQPEGSPLCGPHLRGRNPASANDRLSTPQQHRTSGGDRGPLPPGSSTLLSAGPSSHRLQGPSLQLPGSLLQLQGSPPRLQEPPPG